MADLITRDEIKDHLQIVDTDSDTKLNSLITEISAFVENYCNVSFTTLTEYTEYFNGKAKSLIMEHVPIDSITSVTDTLDSSVVDLTTYKVYKQAGYIAKNDESLWGTGLQRWEIIYKAGYTSVPEQVKLATKMLVSDAFVRKDLFVISESRGDKTTKFVDKMPNYLSSLLDPYVNRIAF